MFAIPRRIIVGLVLASLCCAAALTGTTFRAEATGSEYASVIVEFKEEPAAFHAARAGQQGRAVSDEELQARRSALRAGQDRFLSELRARGVAFDLRSVGVAGVGVEFRYTLVFNGVALKVPASAVDSIKAMPQVKDVHPDSTLYTTLAGSVKYIRAPEVYGGVAELGPFDDLREGFEGQGINISIIDTGIDHPHPMFGGDPTPPRLGVAPASASVNTNKKVIYSLPLADIAAEDGFGHGTHVASTAAGYLGRAPGSDLVPMTSDDVDIHGVAPQAKLMSYKVCSDVLSTVSQVQPVGGCDSSAIIMALEDSVSPFTVNGFAKPKAHVINMSLGGAGGPDSPTAVASDNAVKLGAVVVASAGNSGPGEATVGAPAAGARVIAVAANTKPGAAANWSADVLAASAVNRNVPGAVAPASGLPAAAGFERLKLFPMAGTPAPPAGALAQYYVLVTQPQTPAGFPASVRGRIALVKNNSGLPGGTFAQIANNAAAAGAVGLVLISTTENPTAVTAPIPAATISPAQGEILVDAMLSNDDNGVDPPAGTLSELPIRVNPFLNNTFVGEMAGFSSRGPVRGFGQVKPDVTAPGVDILAAVPPASLLGALSLGSYGAIDGTSMSGPHVAGVAALMKQAHPTWNADMIRTALINTATNLRSGSGAPKAGGLGGDSVNDQGGGLVDVVEAVNARALMGVAGDGVSSPTILGSHSYGEVPVANSRVTHTAPVTVTIRDLSGQGGTYNLSLENNRDLQLEGVDASLGATSVNVPANGSATFTVNATVDGDLIRSTLAAKASGSQVVVEPIQMQWYVTAARADGGERLRMPFYLRPSPSEPESPVVTPQSFSGIVAAGDAGEQLVSGVTFVDHPFEVSASTYRVEARLDYLTQEAQDMDFHLLDPDGSVVASSAIFGGPEQFAARVERPGTYRYRVVGFANGPVTYTITGSLSSGPPAPAVQTITGEFVDAQGRQVDFDGNFTVSWQPEGDERSFEVERSSDGGQTWELIATAAAGTTSLALTNQPDGTHSFRVRGLHDGRIGFYVTPGGAAQSVLVDRRALVDITNAVQTAMSNVSFTGGVFQFDLAMTNGAAENYLPQVSFRVVQVNSASGTVRVANADNGGAGTPGSPALFDYSNRLGSDQVFSAGETTAPRTLRFSDPRAELFTFDARVTAYRRTAGSAGAAAAGAEGGGAGGAPAGSGGVGLQSLTTLLRFTADPLTGVVSAKLAGGL